MAKNPERPRLTKPEAGAQAPAFRANGTSETGMYKAMIWAAVSTAEQAAEDKFSLENQVARCRDWLAARRIREAAEPAIVAGHSREYLSIDAALADIPELGYMLDQARRRLVNLVVTYDLNRWRSLQITVTRALAAYGCQVYALNQPVEPQRPDVFSPYNSDTAQIISIISSLTSSLDIASLRRKYTENMPKRVERRGLALGKLPYGYAKPAGHEHDASAVGVPVSAEVPVVLWIKQQYLAGSSASRIAHDLQEQGVPTRFGGTWNKDHVLNIVTNPYYAGLVAHSRSRYRRDPMTGRARVELLPRSEWVVAQGRHQGLWSDADWLRMCELRDARGAGISGRTKRTNVFSRLLICAECGSRLWHATDRHAVPFYACKTRGRARFTHAIIYDSEIAEQFRAALAEILVQLPDSDARELSDQATSAGANIAALNARLDEVDAAKTRYQRAYGAGIIGDADLADRLAELRAERRLVQEQLDAIANTERAAHIRATRRATLDDILVAWDAIAAGDPVEANALLSDAIASIVVTRGQVTEIRLK